MEPVGLKRRLDGIRTLRGMTQKDFAAACHTEGLGKQEAARVERGELKFRSVHRMVFAAVLRVPPSWFEADLDQLFWAADSATGFSASAQDSVPPRDERRESPEEEDDDEDAADRGG